MPVESHAETGDERKAVADLLPHIVGNFQIAAGSGPLRRAACTDLFTTAGDRRGQARAGGFGMLGLTALTFSLMSEARAADPNVTFLDDGNITYKDLAHGAFELVTKEVIPRYFLVEDPGQTIVLRSQGSSVSVSQSTNSPARMAELQAAQQEALSTYEKGLGSTGSSTPPDLDPLPVQPINFIQDDGSTPAQELPAMPGALFVAPPDIIIAKLVPPPTPPTLNAIAGPTEIDTTVFDVFTATNGTFLASSPNSAATLTFGINGGTAGSTVIDGVNYDVSRAGPYGTLYVDSTTGAYAFVPNNDAINALVAPTTTDFTITVSDGTLSASQPFTIAINGTNDAAVISGATHGTAIEAGGVANTAHDALSATGILKSADVDDAPNTFAAVSTPTESAHGFGTFTMTKDGVWTYTVNDANSTVQALNVGDKLTDCFSSHFWRHDRLGDRGQWHQVRPADRDRHAHRYRRRQPTRFYGDRLSDGQPCRLWHLHDEGGRRVDLQAGRQQLRGAGTQCRRQADRLLYGDHHRRHRAGGDGHHLRHQRPSHHLRNQGRLGHRG
jgi:VCBS repeat-containing protein